MGSAKLSPLRVGYVVNTFPKLSQTFIDGELAELRRRGVEVRILSLEKPADEPRHPLPTQAGLTAVTVYERAEFPAVLRAFQPDLLHAHFATAPTAEARLLAAELSVPFTFTAHGFDVYRRPPADFAARAAAAAGVVTVSAANARHIMNLFAVPAAHLHVIPCGVDTARFRPAVATRAIPAHVVCVARHEPVKNLGLLIDACVILRACGVAFLAVLVGDGSCRNELEAARKQRGLEAMVYFAGAADQDQVLDWWQRASIAVLSSSSEGMPVSLMEAAACGVPAVAPAVGGIPELIEDGITGLVVPPGDAGAMAAALERLLRDTALAARLGAAARRRAVERFAVSSQVDSLLTLWKNVLGGRHVDSRLHNHFDAVQGSER